MKKPIKETMEEFLARGGKVQMIPSTTPETPTQPISPTSVGPVVILTYGDADLYYGEVRSRKSKKPKLLPKIDFSALPEPLRNKYKKELINGEKE